jgi:hypothetical protein
VTNESFVIVRGDDGVLYYVGLAAARRDGTVTAGARVAVLGIEGRNAHEITAVGFGSGPTTEAALAQLQGARPPAAATAPAPPAPTVSAPVAAPAAAAPVAAQPPAPVAAPPVGSAVAGQPTTPAAAPSAPAAAAPSAPAAAAPAAASPAPPVAAPVSQPPAPAGSQPTPSAPAAISPKPAAPAPAPQGQATASVPATPPVASPTPAPVTSAPVVSTPVPPAPGVVPTAATSSKAAVAPPAAQLSAPMLPVDDRRWTEVTGEIEAFVGRTVVLKVDGGRVTVDVSSLSGNLERMVAPGSKVKFYGVPVELRFKAMGFIDPDARGRR